MKIIRKIKKVIAESRLAPLFLDTDRYGKMIPNINWDPLCKQKRVLITYLDIKEASVQIMDAYEESANGTIHTNRYELFVIIKEFIDRNYCIDVCANDDVKAQRYLIKNRYDIVFGMGENGKTWKCDNCGSRF